MKSKGEIICEALCAVLRVQDEVFKEIHLTQEDLGALTLFVNVPSNPPSSMILSFMDVTLHVNSNVETGTLLLIRPNGEALKVEYQAVWDLLYEVEPPTRFERINRMLG